MAKLLLLGMGASMIVGAVIALGLNAVNANGGIGGVAFVLGACIAGLIGAAVSHRMPPRGRQH